MTLVVGCP
jgi:hypothetical protein